MIAALGVVLCLRGRLSVNAAEDFNGLLRAIFCFAAGTFMYRALALSQLSERATNLVAGFGLVLAVLGSGSVHSNFL
jgi:hypothetical protein